MQEIWKDIDGWEGFYQISNLGRVKSCRRYIRKRGRLCLVNEKFLKMRQSKDGYYRVFLRNSGNDEQYLVHRLVAKAFIPNPDDLPCVNHKDESRTNNCVDNLEWCTNEYNLHYGTADSRWLESQHNKRLTEEHKRKIGDAQRGKLNHRYGKKLTEEHRKKLSDGAKKYWQKWRIESEIQYNG